MKLKFDKATVLIISNNTKSLKTFGKSFDTNIKFCSMHSEELIHFLKILNFVFLATIFR